jgi:TonB-linked SusC/RagA family outer membrane protein
MRLTKVLLLLALIVPSAVRAQATGRITGTVTAEGGQPVPGVNVIVVGTTLGAVANDSGRFTIVEVPAGTHQVQARRIGFTAVAQPVTVTAGQAATVSLQLTATAVQLSSVVSVGYGTQSRREVTGAVASVRSADITQVVTANPADAIKGRLPGVDVTSASGEPGAAANIRVRGTRSITASNSPLFVVDGVPIEGDLRDFDANSIESMEVLKDAASAAVYGSRGANGVILVTTKRGRAGKTQFSYNGTAGFSTILNKIDMMNGQQFADFRREAYRAAGNYPCPGREVCAAGDSVALDAKMLAGLEAGVSTDWQDEILRTGALQNHQLAVSGGNENTRFRASVGYLDQRGITITQDYNAKTGTISATHDFGRLNVQVSAQAAQTLRNAGRGVGLWDEALFNSPLGRVRDSTGALIFLPTDDGIRVNPLSEAENYARDIERTNILGTLSGSYEILNGLRAHVNFGPQYSNVDDGFFVGTFTRQNRGVGLPSAAETNARRRNYTLSTFLEYNKEFGANHKIGSTLLYEVAKNRLVFDTAAARDLPYPHQLWYNLGSGRGYAVGSRLEESALQSYMGRVNYTLLDRYTVTLTGRVDGSSVLAPGNKYAFFPAAAFAWQIGDEAFMRAVPAITDLKLRMSYGRVGNSAVAPYSTQGTLATVWYSYGQTNPAVVGFAPGALPNPGLKWETTNKYNVGVDFGLFKQRITGAIDAYIEDTDNLLLTRALPFTTGFSSILENVGKTRNRGVELQLTTINLAGWHGLEWSSDLAFSMNRNKIVALAGGQPFDIGSGRWVGQPIQVNYTWKFLGIWQQSEEAEAAAMGFKPGDIKVADLNGDGQITGDDRTFIGNHFNFPDWQGSFNNRLRYRDFDLSMLMTTRQGFDVPSVFVSAYTNLAGRFNNRNVNYWTPDNPSNSYPRPSTFGVGQYLEALSIKDASYVRVRDITLGYQLPASLTARMGGTGRARVYVKAQDPFLFTDFDGWDPEVGFSTGNPNFTTSQIDIGGPSYRTFLFGLDLNF